MFLFLVVLFFKEEEFFANLDKLGDCTSILGAHIPFEEEDYLVPSVWN